MANIFGFHVSGLTAWLIWLFIHLMYIVEFQNRVLVFIQWGFEYLTFSRGARLITGSADTDVDQQPKAPPEPLPAHRIGVSASIVWVYANRQTGSPGPATVLHGEELYAAKASRRNNWASF